MPKYNLNDVLMAYRADARGFARNPKFCEASEIVCPLRFDSVASSRKTREDIVYFAFVSCVHVDCAYVVYDEVFDVASTLSTTLLLSEFEIQVKKLT